jgi:glycosyltransferase involved in cell wall biosynthesis
MRISRREGPPCLWYELTGLGEHSGHVTGIQRAISGVAHALLDGPETALPVRFCTFRKKQGYFEVDRTEVEVLLATLGRSRFPRPRTPLQKLVGRARKAVFGREPLVAPFGPTDVLLNLGFANHPVRHRPTIAKILARTGVRYVGFIYDVLVLRRPEWWTLETQTMTRDWFLFTGHHASMVLCCSNATRRDAAWFFEHEGLEAPPLATVRLAGDFPAMKTARSEARPPRRRPYVLYVSTFDVRKNHRLLFQVWKRLLAKHGADAVPDLVCVGRKGALVKDFLTEVDNAHRLGGRIVLEHDVDDAELARLYAGCLFTVFPSIAEGWGIPVTEGLSYGKYCVASSASSIPEVGGDLIDYHDPFDLERAFEQIERAAFDPDFRAQKETAIRERWRHDGWNDSVDEIMRAVAPLTTERPQGGAATVRA